MQKSKVRQILLQYYGAGIQEAELVKLTDVTTLKEWRHVCAEKGIVRKKPERIVVPLSQPSNKAQAQGYMQERVEIYSLLCPYCNTVIYYEKE